MRTMSSTGLDGTHGRPGGGPWDGAVCRAVAAPPAPDPEPSAALMGRLRLAAEIAAPLPGGWYYVGDNIVGVCAPPAGYRREPDASDVEAVDVIQPVLEGYGNHRLQPDWDRYVRMCKFVAAWDPGAARAVLAYVDRLEAACRAAAADPVTDDATRTALMAALVS